MSKAPIAPDVDLILFDLDNTLYPRENTLWPVIDERIRQFVANMFDLDEEAARIMQKRFWQHYGTTIAGLMHEYNIDPAEYLHYVHDIEIERHLGPNAQLACTLAMLPQRKAIFTNATVQHAERVLQALGIRPHFDALIGIAEVGYISKPAPQAYERCLALLGVPGSRCLFIEDSPANLPPARDLGMRTVFITDDTARDGIADYYLTRIEDIGQLFALNPCRDEP